MGMNFQNPIAGYRMPNIFQPRPSKQSQMFKGMFATPPVEAGVPEEEEDYYSQIMKMRQNPGPGTTAYKKLIGEQPKLEDNQPTGWGRFGAAMSGLGAGIAQPGSGSEVAENALSIPYRYAMGDYTTRLKGAQEAAILEREEAADSIAAMEAAQRSGIAYKEYQRKAENDQNTYNVNMKRAEAYIQSLDDQNWSPSPQRDGSVLLINRRTGARRTVPADTVAAFSARSQARNGEVSANAAATNAQTNRFNAQTNFERLGQGQGQLDVNRFNADTSRMRLGQRNPPTAGNVAIAQNLALGLIAANPRFSAYVVPPDENNPNYSIKPNDGSVEYMLFMQELRNRTNNVNRRGSAIGGDFDLDYDYGDETGSYGGLGEDLGDE